MKLSRFFLAAGLGTCALGMVVGCSDNSSSGGAMPPAGTAGSSSPTSGGGASASLTGAGSSFVYPAMSKWAYTYQGAHAGTTINYQSVGSSAGISQYKAGTVDFGATDVPMTDAELKDMPAGTIQVPVAAGCEVLAYNLPGVPSGVKLTDQLVSGIFMGKIKNWSDPAIAKENAGMKLPSSPITVVHRSDGSGTTYAFTDYLSAVSPEWKAGPGKGKSVNWPTGVAGKGNDGVAGLVKQTPGAIGYVELAYAIQTKLTYADLKNKSGVYVKGTIEGTTAAANAAIESMKKDIRVSIVNGESKDAYPISTFTYVILNTTQKDAAKGKALTDFLTYVLTDGQKESAALQYAPLPDAVVDLDKALIAQVK